MTAFARAPLLSDGRTGGARVRPGSADDAGLFSIGQYLSQAILLEVSAHPKPGLVTRRSNGAHRDMSILTFAMSSAVLSRAFYELEAMGAAFDGAPEALLAAVRGCGVEAERALLRATKGVNTQRGILFSGGLLSAAAGYTAARGQRADAVLDTVRRMTAGLVARELGGAARADATAGERLFCAHGVTGIRGEAERGFPSVTGRGLPALEEAFRRGANLNDALVHSLLALMTVVQDTNVIFRAGLAAADEVKDTARAILASGSVFTARGRARLAAADEAFIRRRVSPGGSADLLSVSIALYLLAHGTFPVAIL